MQKMDEVDLPFGIGDVVSNRDIMNTFKCACEGGIRYSSRTGTVIVVRNNAESAYPGKWQGRRMEYIGQGAKGDQQMTRMNKRLKEFLEKGKNVYFFEAERPGEYEYKGIVRQYAAPFQKIIEDKGGERKVWVFPLELASRSNEADRGEESKQ